MENSINNTIIGDKQEVDVEYVYLTIPASYVCVYHKLLAYMADLGRAQIEDCNSTCKGNGKNIISCWNLFQSAIACHALGQDKEAEFFIDYIKTQLTNLYKGQDKEVFSNSVPLAITKDGKLKAAVSCGSNIKFYVDTETGKLLENVPTEVDINREYTIDNGNLVYKDKE